MPTFDTPEPISVVIDLGAANIVIEAAARDDTTVVLRPTNTAGEGGQKAAALAMIDYAGGTLVVRSPRQRFLRSRTAIDGLVDLTVRVPAGSNVEAKSPAKFSSTGRLGNVKIDTPYGDIRLEHCGPAHLKTSSGDIWAGRIDGPADVRDSSGSIHINHLDGIAIVKASSGSISVGDVVGDLRASSASGNISVGRAGASVGVKTSSGSIRVAEVTGDAVVLDSGAGSIDVGIHDGVPAFLDVKSWGEVRILLEPDTAPLPDVEAAVRIRARSSAGAITVRRAA